MKRAFLFAALAGVWLMAGGSACTNAIFGTNEQAAKTVAVEAVISACNDFQQAVRVASARKWLGVLDAQRIATIDGVIVEITPLCPGTGGGQMPPGGPTDATVSTIKGGTARIVAAFTVN